MNQFIIKKVAGFLSATAMAISLIGCSGEVVQPSPREALLGRLKEAAGSYTFFYAHQDDLVYGHTWRVKDTEGDPLLRSDIRSVCGYFPAIVGFDLGGIELGSPENLDGVPFDLIRRAAVTHSERGGIVTFSWHPRNPLTGGDAWDVSSDKVVESVLPRGARSEDFALWLSRLGEFLGSIVDSSGEPVPFIFRPWHENIGSWFWWGGGLCTASQYKDLYMMTVDYLRGDCALDNILYAYSPNSGVTPAQYMERYPGDDYVDILGTDHYEYVGEGGNLPEADENYVKTLRAELGNLSTLAVEHGKVMVLSETGYEGIRNPRWWTEVLLPVVKEYPIAYLLTWRNAHDKPTHFYAPFPGSGDAEDFYRFAMDPATLFLEK